MTPLLTGESAIARKQAGKVLCESRNSQKGPKLKSISCFSAPCLWRMAGVTWGLAEYRGDMQGQELSLSALPSEMLVSVYLEAPSCWTCARSVDSLLVPHGGEQLPCDAETSCCGTWR